VLGIYPIGNGYQQPHDARPFGDEDLVPEGLDALQRLQHLLLRHVQAVLRLPWRVAPSVLRSHLRILGECRTFA
jgi:hypothetical protein